MLEPEMLDCGHMSTPDGFATGYACDGDKRICYDCCAKIERQAMIDTGKATLYLVGGQDEHCGYEVTNWPGNMRFNVRSSRRGRHNMTGKRIDVWFVGPDRHWWWGVQYGDMTQIVHCKRTKEVA